MSFDFSALRSAESYWDQVSIGLAIAVAIGVSMEAVTEFDTLAGWLRLDTQERFALRHGIAKAGLLLLIIALAFEVVSAIRAHDINEEIIGGLNGEIAATQKREQDLIKETEVLQHTLSRQGGTLESLAGRTDNFETTANKLKARLENSLTTLDRAQSDAVASAGKASMAAQAANKAASDMATTLNAEKAMQEGMRELVTPRVLTPEQIATLSESLKVFQGTPFAMYITDDPDARNLFPQITSSLETAGWIWKDAPIIGDLAFRTKGKPTSAIVSTTGFAIDIAESSRPTLEKPTLALLNSLHSFGIRAVGTATPDEKMDPGIDKTIIHIIIGKR